MDLVETEDGRMLHKFAKDKISQKSLPIYNKPQNERIGYHLTIQNLHKGGECWMGWGISSWLALVSNNQQFTYLIEYFFMII
jgi:hypothetical protein